jgi:HTH-type transcriptional regulator, sugar sensing transcriptional regulator
MDDIIEKLRTIGLNSYEAKVYLALLKHHPVTGYEVSKESGVPQARAYDTLKSLESQNIVVALGNKPTTYVPISPDELLNRWEKQTQSDVAFLRETLPQTLTETVEPVINLQGAASIYQYAKEMIVSAKHTLFMELWQEDAPELLKDLKAAKKRGVELRIVGYNNLQLDFCDVYNHGLSYTIEEEMGGRWMIIAADHNEGLAGSVSVKPGPDGSKPRQPHAVFTRNLDIVLIIKELVVHDIFLLDVEDKLSEPLEAVYGKNLMSLRQKILGASSTIYSH